ncbi:MAG: hypothetical protein Q9183_001319, partial [Haloplaca sp. 2 TL-2023]
MTPKETIPSEISGYRILPITLPPLPAFNVSATHYLYLRHHEPKFPSPSATRSLFLVNVPFDSTEYHIKNLLSTQVGLPQGRIEDVRFDGATTGTQNTEESAIQPRRTKKSKKRKRDPESGGVAQIGGAALPKIWNREILTDGLTAVVVFVDRASMDAAFKAVKRVPKDVSMPIWGKDLEDKIPPLGPASTHTIVHFYLLELIRVGYLDHHRRQYPDRNQLLDSVNTYMSEYAAQEAARARARATQRQVPDEDGFITVTKGGRNDPVRQEVAQQLLEKQKERQTGLTDFYRFQSREKKKEKAAELMRKFEEDKGRLERMKERRGTFR